jgi:hypothetical protein
MQQREGNLPKVSSGIVEGQQHAATAAVVVLPNKLVCRESLVAIITQEGKIGRKTLGIDVVI